jgi:hypothetical protein
MPSQPLPIRIAQSRHASLNAFNDTYFQFLKRQGCTGIYLQNSPFDPTRSGHNGQFFRPFHLISLFDISRSHRRAEYQDYINEICKRARNHGLEVWLDCWEPRLPAYARRLLPPEWRGRGGWEWHGNKHIAFCWEHPEAVAYWKSMTQDAMAALPGLSGVIVSMIDNESSLCDTSCPRCEGRSMEKGILDIYTTFTELAVARPKPLRIALYDWWMPTTLVEQIQAILPAGSLIIGRSARGLRFTSADGSWSGHIEDISNISNTISENFHAHCKRAIERSLQPIDMVSWSRGLENFFLPAPPDPRFGIEKSRALANAGSLGWIDYDCGCIEEGSLAAGMREWNAEPAATDEILFERTLKAIWGASSHSARKAYEDYQEAKGWMPTGISSKDVNSFDSRGLGLGYCLFGPFHLDDMAFYDVGHARNWFAPFSLITESTIPLLLKSSSQIMKLLEAAIEVLSSISPPTPAAEWEKCVFEIYHRSFRAFWNYTRLTKAKWDHGKGQLTNSNYQDIVREIASNELSNIDGTKAWNTAHPGVLGNPCHRILGHSLETWPDADYSKNIFEPKRRSLTFLRDEFDPTELIPGYFIQGALTDDGGL